MSVKFDDLAYQASCEDTWDAAFKYSSLAGADRGVVGGRGACAQSVGADCPRHQRRPSRQRHPVRAGNGFVPAGGHPCDNGTKSAATVQGPASPPLWRIRPSARASSQTGKRGQELFHASMTSSRLRGRSATHCRNWIMIRVGWASMAQILRLARRGRPVAPLSGARRRR